MALALYMDHNVPRAITLELRRRGVDVLTAYEDDASAADDVTLLDRARELGRALFTRDDDLVKEAHRRQRQGVSFPGVIYVHQLRASIGTCVQQLETIAKAGEPDDLRDRVEYLPL